MTCKKCGSERLFLRKNAKNENHTELICKDCGAWQKFVSKEDARLIEMSDRQYGNGEITEPDLELHIIELLINDADKKGIDRDSHIKDTLTLLLFMSELSTFKFYTSDNVRGF